MNTQTCRRAEWGGMVLLLAVSTVSARPAATPVWERAAQAYDLCMKLYNLSDWEKAASAFRQFIEKYPTNQNIPLAWIQLADCHFNLGQEKEALAALDVLTKKYFASRMAGEAWGKKLEVARNRNQPDLWLDLYEEMSRQFGKAPLGLSSRTDWRRLSDYWWGIDNTYFFYPRWRRTGWYLQAADTNMGWVSNLLWAADTPQRALRALDILAVTFKTFGDDLPEDWKYAHVLLLRQAALATNETNKTNEKTSTAGNGAGKTSAGKSVKKFAARAAVPATSSPAGTARNAKKKVYKPVAPDAAEKQWQAYLNAYPKNDPRLIGLWMREAEYWFGKDPHRTDKIWSDMMEAFPGYDSLGAFAARRMDFLYDQRRYDDFVKMARWYLKYFPLSDRRDAVIGQWITLAREKADQGEKGELLVVLRVLEEEQKRYPQDPVRQRRDLERRIDLHLTGGEVSQAVARARELIDDAHWSAESFSKLEFLARDRKEFQELLAEVRKTRGIPAADETSSARALYENLQARIADNQTRHMEELGEKLFSERRDDAWTILAIKSLVDYYYAKALPEPRDKWVDLMGGAYPFHPLTQDVLAKQAEALYGAKEFQRAGTVYDLLLDRFPGSDSADAWFNRRIDCFSALKDIAGRSRYARSRLEARAAEGEIEAIGRLGDILEAAAEGHKAKGDFWMPWCEKWGEKTYQGVYCYAKAYEAYYVAPTQQWHWDAVHFPSAVRVAKALRTQTIRPELAWKLNFEDINVMGQGDMGAEALKTLAERLQQTPQTFRISDRLDLPNFGRAVGNAKLAARGRSIFQQIFSQCRLRTDRYHLHIMLGAMYKQAGMFPQAAKSFLDAGAMEAIRPIDAWGTHVEAAGCLWEARSPAYLTLQMRYFNQIRTAQDVSPRLLLGCVKFCKANNALPRAGGYVKKLRTLFAASAHRGEAEQEIRRR